MNGPPHHDVHRVGGSEPAGEVTRLLGQLQGGDARAVYERLLPLVHDELRGLASGFLRRERVDHTLQPTALVNEAFIRLAVQREPSWESRAHFLAIAATAMRRILVDHARGRGRIRRGGKRRRELLESDMTAVEADGGDILALDQALSELASVDVRKVLIIEMRFFVGMTVEETAAALGVSTPTVKREWAEAKAWLRRELG